MRWLSQVTAIKGMMQARCDRFSMQAMAMGSLTFGSQEVRRIQAEVARREMKQ